MTGFSTSSNRRTSCTGESDRTGDFSFGPAGRSSAALNDDFVDICDFQQFAADGVEPGAPERADREPFHMGAIDAQYARDDRDAPDKAQRSRGRGDDENSDRMVDIFDLDRDLICRPHHIYAISVYIAIAPPGFGRCISAMRRNTRLIRRKPPYSRRYGGHTETAMLARDEDILKAAEDWRREGRGVALATVVETWGSAPRPVGSNLVIDNDGNFLGSVSGGCVEGAVVTEAMDVIDSGKPRDAGIRRRRRDRLEGRPLLRRYHPGLRGEGGVASAFQWPTVTDSLPLKGPERGRVGWGSAELVLAARDPLPTLHFQGEGERVFRAPYIAAR